MYKEKNQITYGGGEVYNSYKHIQGFEIRYEGAISIDYKQDNWIVMANDKKIIGANMNKHTEDLLFTYEGNLKITSIDIVIDNKLQNGSFTLLEDNYITNNNKYSSLGKKWKTYNKTSSIGRPVKKTFVKNIENNLTKKDRKDY